MADVGEVEAPAEDPGVGRSAADRSAAPDDLASRSTLHAVTGHLVVRLSGCGLSDAALRSWASAQLLPQIEVFRGAGNAVLRLAEFDLSHNELTDAGLASLFRVWGKTGAACPLLLKLHFNRLGDPALATLAAFVRAYRGQVRELHLTNNEFSSHEAVLDLLESFAGLPQYPMWNRRQRRYAPVYLRLGHCRIPEPAELLQRASSQGSMRLCLMEDGNCLKTLCKMAERGIASSCPVAHLWGFLQQDSGQAPEPPGTARASTSAVEEPTGESMGAGGARERSSEPSAAATAPASEPAAGGATASASSSAAAAAAPGAARQRESRSYTCGACSRSLPLDMFGRHQFRKAAAVDALPEGTEDRPGGEPATPAHLVRRCNDCVKQPCCACGDELPLSSFARSQMLRPSGQRRCRTCAAETMLCIRCEQPKPRSAFSQLEVLKRKRLPRVCSDCEQTNPYFERRYGIVLGFSHPRSRTGSSAGLPVPRLPLDILRRIVAFSDPGDEFTRIYRRDFECGLCSRSWSFATNDVDRHIRHQMHRQRLEKLQRGLLVRIGSVDIETSRFRSGLGIKGAVCSRERVEEARALVRVEDAMAQGLAREALRVAGMAPESDWVPPRLVEVALQLQLGSAVPPEPQVSSAEVKSAQRRWKLFGHLGAEAEGHEEAAEELSALNAMLSFE